MWWMFLLIGMSIVLVSLLASASNRWDQFERYQKGDMGLLQSNLTDADVLEELGGERIWWCNHGVTQYCGHFGCGWRWLVKL